MKRFTKSGITQLELLVSLAIMGITAVLLANAFNFNRQSLDRVHFLTKETEMNLAQHTLRELVGAIPKSVSDTAADILLTGDEKSLRFQSKTTEATSQLTKFALSISEKNGGNFLLVETMTQNASQNDMLGTTHMIAKDVSALKISYYGQRSSDAEPQWQRTWEDALYLPDLVKLEWKNDQGRPFPPLILQPGKQERQSTISRSSLVPPG